MRTCARSTLGRGMGKGSERVIWNPEYECMDRSALHDAAAQAAADDRLVGLRAGAVLPRADGRRGECVRATSGRSTTCASCPFTDKTALRDTYPFGMFALPLDEVVRIHSSSGTTGKPIVVGYSRGDINTWTELTARVAAAAGVHRRRPGADGVPLRHVHRRLGHALRHRAHRRDRSSRPAAARPSATS